MLINTSLNGPGDPLTETPEQSVDTLRNTGMHALAIPPFLWSSARSRPCPTRTGSARARPVASPVS